MSSQAVLQVITTTDSPELAESIARKLVAEKLAACVQVTGPIKSVYRWEGKVETSAEWKCEAKTTGDNYERVEAAIRELHTYDEPEIIATEVVAGSESYLNWVRSECGGA